MLGFLTSKWVLGGLTGLVLLGFVYWKGYTSGKDVIQKKWNAEKVILERAVQEAKEETRQKEIEMQDRIVVLTREKNHAVKTADARYNALIDSLRNRPEERRDPATEGAPDSVGCTGAGLARDDAEFLAWYATEAAKLQAAYNSCRDSYDEVRNKINK